MVQQKLCNPARGNVNYPLEWATPISATTEVVDHHEQTHGSVVGSFVVHHHCRPGPDGASHDERTLRSDPWRYRCL